MSLSEHEKRVLAEIEQALVTDDPSFVQRAHRVASGSRRWRLVLAALAFVLGLVLLFSLTFHLAFGFVGAALMIGAVVLGVDALVRQRALNGDALAARLRRVFGKHDQVG